MSLPFRLDRSIVLTGLAALGMVLAIVGLWPLEGAVAASVSALGLLLVYLAGGLPAAWRALTTLWNERVLDIDLLMVIAAVAAASVGAPFEGAVLLTLFSISTTLEERALGRARRAIEALMDLRPETALRRAADGTVEEIPAAELEIDDIFVLRPGARVPADGIIVSGRGSLDEANITGESMPVAKERGAQLGGGAAFGAPDRLHHPAEPDFRHWRHGGARRRRALLPAAAAPRCHWP